jgi:hypothetical protein
MLLLSCGAALHHAVIALRSAGFDAGVERLPDPDRPDLAARMHKGNAIASDPMAAAQYRAIYARRTDRRPFSNDRPTPADLAALREAAERHGVHLHVLPESALPEFVAAVWHAAAAEHAEPSVRKDIATWSGRSVGARDGINPQTSVASAWRTVPTRDFMLGQPAGLAAGDGTDCGTVYALLFTDGDEPRDWLAAGEALSDVWLTLTARGMAASPISEVVEVDGVRQALRRLLAGAGYPAITLRIGMPVDRQSLPPPSVRRSSTDVVELPGR